MGAGKSWRCMFGIHKMLPLGRAGLVGVYMHYKCARCNARFRLIPFIGYEKYDDQ